MPFQNIVRLWVDLTGEDTIIRHREKEKELVDRAIKCRQHSKVGKIAILDLNSFWIRATVWCSTACASSWMLWEIVLRFLFRQKGSNTPSFSSLLISYFLFSTFLLWETLTYLERKNPKLRNYRLASVNHHGTSGDIVSWESVRICENQMCLWMVKLSGLMGMDMKVRTD